MNERVMRGEFAGVAAKPAPESSAITDPKALESFRRNGILGLGESYMDGHWDVPSLDAFMYSVFTAPEFETRSKPWLALAKHMLRDRIINPQSGWRAFNIAKRHYDLGNDLFEAMLDNSMTYTCGYWKDASTLDEAQDAKLDRACRKLGLKPGMRVLDIGCGWGNFAKHAATHYGVSVTGVTVSKEQAAHARESTKHLPVEIRLQDYRELDEKFDAIVSLEMIEAVGKSNIPDFYRVAERCLKDDGLFLVQVISAEMFNSKSDRRLDEFLLWIVKYIFPEGYLPNLRELTQQRGRSFVIEDFESFGPDYDHTLLAWAKNFNASWNSLSDTYDERFRRMWNFYLLSCAAVFRARLVNLYQIVYAKQGSQGGRVERTV